MRLNRFISDSGYCSRREADKLIESGKVTINKMAASLGDRVGAGDKVRINGNLVEGATEYAYLLLNKPQGISPATDSTNRTNVLGLINYPTKISSISRLDKDSEGVMLFTNDGEVIAKITKGGESLEKEFEVWVDKPIDSNFIERLSTAISNLGSAIKPARVEQESALMVRIVVTVGGDSQIRRICEACGYIVTKIRRTRLGNISLASLESGEWRDLESNEIAPLLAQLRNGGSKSSRWSKSLTSTPSDRKFHSDKSRSGSAPRYGANGGDEDNSTPRKSSQRGAARNSKSNGSKPRTKSTSLNSDNKPSRKGPLSDNRTGRRENSAKKSFGSKLRTSSSTKSSGGASKQSSSTFRKKR